MFTVDVSGSESQRHFCEVVGGFGPREGAAVALWLALETVQPNTNVDTLPIETLSVARASMAKRGVSATRMAALRRIPSGGTCFKAPPSRGLMREFGTVLNDAELIALSESDLFWDRITSIEPAGEEEVYDLTVPGPANWLADGILTHNSGAIEQDADIILLIYREEVYDKQTTRKGIAEIHMVKHRNGEIGMFELTFQGMYSRFKDFMPDSYADGILK